MPLSLTWAACFVIRVCILADHGPVRAPRQEPSQWLPVWGRALPPDLIYDEVQRRPPLTAAVPSTMTLWAMTQKDTHHSCFSFWLLQRHSCKGHVCTETSAGSDYILRAGVSSVAYCLSSYGNDLYELAEWCNQHIQRFPGSITFHKTKIHKETLWGLHMRQACVNQSKSLNYNLLFCKCSVNNPNI